MKENIQKKIYENPLDIGIFLRFEDAVKVLSTEPCSLNKRLYRAYYDCGIFHLHNENFKDEYIRSNLNYIETMVNIGTEGIRKIKLPPGVYARPQQFDLHWKQASKTAKSIFNIYKYLIKITESEENG